MASLRNVFLCFTIISSTLAMTPPKTNRYRVSTLVHEPFVMETEVPGVFKGLLIDFFNEIASGLNFTADYFMNPDHTYGMRSATGAWTGNIGQVIEGKADVALAATTINSDRMRVVKFSLPFMTSGLTAVGRAIDFPVSVENVPKIVRMVEAGNISVGIMKGGSSFTFFQNTMIPEYRKLFEAMSTDPSNFVTNYSEGMEKVREAVGKPYVFFCEKSFVDYYTSKWCDVKPLSCETLNVIHYAFVYKLNISEECYHKVNLAISDMLQSGRLQLLQHKWFGHDCDPLN